MFTDQCDPSPKKKLNGTKGYAKTHNAHDRIKLLEKIKSFVYSTEAHLKGKWATTKVKKLYTFLQRRNITDKDYMKEFDAYIKVIK